MRMWLNKYSIVLCLVTITSTICGAVDLCKSKVFYFECFGLPLRNIDYIQLLKVILGIVKLTMKQNQQLQKNNHLMLMKKNQKREKFSEATMTSEWSSLPFVFFFFFFLSFI